MAPLCHKLAGWPRDNPVPLVRGRDVPLLNSDPFHRCVNQFVRMTMYARDVLERFVLAKMVLEGSFVYGSRFLNECGRRCAMRLIASLTYRVLSAVGVVALALTLISGSAGAQEVAPPGSSPTRSLAASPADSALRLLRQHLRRIEESPSRPVWLGVPGSSSAVPTAFGGSWGSAGVALSYQQRVRYTDGDDGSAAIVVGFGNRQKLVGLDVSVAILDLSRKHGSPAGFGRRGSLSFAVGRDLPGGYAAAVGLENTMNWGGTDQESSAYAVASRRLLLRQSAWEPFSRAYISVGVGNGRFRSEQALVRGGEGVGVFGGVAVQVIPPLAAIAEWTGQDLNLGVSLLPFPTQTLVLTPTLVDVTGNAGDGARLTLAVGWGFSLPHALREPFNRRARAGGEQP